MDSEECLWEGTAVEREEVPAHSWRWRTWRGDLKHHIKVWGYSSMLILWISVSCTIHEMSKYLLGWREREKGSEERQLHSIIYTSIPWTLNRNPHFLYSNVSTWVSRLKVLLLFTSSLQPKVLKKINSLLLPMLKGSNKRTEQILLPPQNQNYLAIRRVFSGGFKSLPKEKR